MIARRLRMNTPSKAALPADAYLTNSQGSSNRVQDVRITGCESEDATWASMEMLAVQQQNTRAKSDKTYHCMISFQEGEHPFPAEIVEIEQRFCEVLAMEVTSACPSCTATRNISICTSPSTRFILKS